MIMWYVSISDKCLWQTEALKEQLRNVDKLSSLLEKIQDNFNIFDQHWSEAKNNEVCNKYQKNAQRYTDNLIRKCQNFDSKFSRLQFYLKFSKK